MKRTTPGCSTSANESTNHTQTHLELRGHHGGHLVCVHLPFLCVIIVIEKAHTVDGVLSLLAPADFRHAHDDLMSVARSVSFAVACSCNHTMNEID